MMRRAWICPGCSHPVVFDNWISQNSDKQIATAACDCGCAYFARIHIRKNADKYRCHRIVYPLTDAHISFYNERKDIVRYKAERHAEYEAIRLQVHALLIRAQKVGAFQSQRHGKPLAQNVRRSTKQSKRGSPDTKTVSGVLSFFNSFHFSSTAQFLVLQGFAVT